MDTIETVLVDDHALFRLGIASILESCPDFKIVGNASDGFEAVQLVRQLRPKLVLMDISMPRCNGIEATRMIKLEFPSIKIVMLTVSDDDEHLFEAIKLGANGYLLKDTQPEKMPELLKNVLQGEAPLSGIMAARLMDEVYHLKRYKNTSQIPADKKMIQYLSNREKEVVRMVANGMSNSEIAEKMVISQNTVKNHLRNILDKLHLQNRIQLAVFAVKSDLLVEENSAPQHPLFGPPH